MSDPGEFTEVPPGASAVLHSLRSVGYDLPTAIADIIDNSLSADADRIRVGLTFDGVHSHVRIEDNGVGMTAAAIEEAMRLGTIHPSTGRATSDHGRFGLGLKTASFSQCRRLTVRSRSSGGDLQTRAWDLDHIEKQDQWLLRRGTWDEASETRLGTISEGATGTIVLWEKLDRVVENPSRASGHADFDRKIQETCEHLSMVFHRLIDARNKGVTIEVNGNKLAGWDPLFSRHPKTSQRPVTKLSINSSYVRVHPYVIPPESRLSSEERRRAAGPRGWLAHQGFYLYRNRRLLVTGGWLGLARKEPQCSLARIRLDVDNTLDELLRIDIRKARAHIPDQIRAPMQQLVDATREIAIKAWKDHAVSRPRVSSSQCELTPMWLMDDSEALPKLRVNTSHPAVQSLRNRIDGGPDALDALLSLLGRAVPVEILLRIGGASPGPASAGQDEANLMEVRRLTREVVPFMTKQGLSLDEISRRLGGVEPWSALQPDKLRAIVERDQ